MKQTQKIKTPIPHGSHVDCSASLTKLTTLQAPIAILSVCVYGRPGFYWWEKRYRCRHRHRFYRCVYARPDTDREKLSQCQFVYHKSRVDSPPIENAPSRRQARDQQQEPRRGLRQPITNYSNLNLNIICQQRVFREGACARVCLVS